jgi:hypothetical protein
MLRTHLKHYIPLTVLALTALVGAPAQAQAPGSWTQIGQLTCRLNPSIGFIIVGPSVDGMPS